MGRQGRTGSAVCDIAVGGPQVVATLLAAPLVRRRYNRWGATAAESLASMPGDELVERPRLTYTRAVTVRAPVAAVWPWLAQIGQGRGGLYSYDGLENLVRCDIHSADVLLPQHQEVADGDLIRLGPEGYPCFRVQRVEPPTALVLVGADPKPPHDVPGPDDPAGTATWQWVLRPIAGGTATRLVVRQRLTYPDGQNLLWHMVEPVAFVMERRMLLGLRDRAERTIAA
ncbi:MAG: hypothetical protein R2737_09805 [Candidatus Nanopelagicales bacterium]